MKRRALLAFAVWFLAGGGPTFAAGSYDREIESARATRIDRLTQPWGWLTLIGNLSLPDGSSTIGRAPTNRIVLPAGPEQFGTITLRSDGRSVSFLPAGGVGVQVDGNDEFESVDLLPGGPNRRPTLVMSGAVAFYLVESGGRLGVHVRDLARHELVDFKGLDYFPADPSWRIEAQWVETGVARQLQLVDSAGGTSSVPVTGKAVFTRGGTTVELLPMVNPNGSLLFVFSDSTSESETYAMRFLTVPPPRDGRIVLDFNRAENPPCAFSPVAACPLPPKENRLPFAVRAGEKIFRGAAH